MNTFRFFWSTHKWTGITIAAFLVVTAGTGFLLLLKKEFAWIQPPTQAGTPGDLGRFLPLSEVWQRVRALDHPDLQEEADIERIDVRPDKVLYKVRSRHNHTEVQVDAVRGTILGTGTRRSDWLENLHDGSWVGKPVHDFVMPLVALAVLFLVFSGLWLWLEPVWRRRRARRARARALEKP